MYRVYIRTRSQVALHKTNTNDPVVAEAAFRALMMRREFWATRSAAVLSLDSHQLEFRRFDRIIPVEEEYAEKLRRGEQMPYWPRYIYPMDLDIIPERSSGYLLCYLKQRVDSPILDPNEPVRLFLDE